VASTTCTTATGLLSASLSCSASLPAGLPPAALSAKVLMDSQPVPLLARRLMDSQLALLLVRSPMVSQLVPLSLLSQSPRSPTDRLKLLPPYPSLFPRLVMVKCKFPPLPFPRSPMDRFKLASRLLPPSLRSATDKSKLPLLPPSHLLPSPRSLMDRFRLPVLPRTQSLRSLTDRSRPARPARLSSPRFLTDKSKPLARPTPPLLSRSPAPEAASRLEASSLLLFLVSPLLLSCKIEVFSLCD